MFCAAMQPTELSEMVQECIVAAIADCGWRLKAVAYDMDIPLSLLSEGLRGEKHLSVQRLSKLGRGFLVQFCKRVMSRLGGVALDADEKRLLLGAAELGPKRMVRMTLPLPREKANAS